MRSEASKRVRARKKLKVKPVNAALSKRRPKGNDLDSMVFGIDVSGKPVSLASYPARQTKRGVTVEVNRGKRTLLEGAFLATTKSGHRGVFLRVGDDRLPIRELLGSRPVDALLHDGEAEAIADRGGRSFGATFERLMFRELSKS